MVVRRSGNVQPTLDLDEHNELAMAKRALLVSIDDSGSDYRSPTVFDYTNSTPLAVVLVEPTTGNAYKAAVGGGALTDVYVSTAATLYAIVNTSSPGLQSVYVSTAVTLYSLIGSPNVTAYLADVPALGVTFPAIAGTVTANLANVPALGVTFPAIAGTVTANLGPDRNVTAYLADVPALGVTFPGIAGTVTANLGPARNFTAYVAASVTLYHIDQHAPGTTWDQAGHVAIDVPTQFLNLGANRSGVLVISDEDNVKPIFLGNATVTVAPPYANSSRIGIKLDPGRVVVVPVNNSNLIYAICPSGFSAFLSYGSVRV